MATSVDPIIDTKSDSSKSGKVINFNSTNVDDELSSLNYAIWSDEGTAAPKLQNDYFGSSFKNNEIPQIAFNRKKSQLALQVVRTHYSKELLKDLDWLAKNHNSNDSRSMPYISTLLQKLSDYCDDYYTDPLSSFLLALYDGLTHDYAYLILDKNAYEKISHIITSLNNQELDYKKIDKYIFKLDEIGLNTTPY